MKAEIGSNFWYISEDKFENNLLENFIKNKTIQYTISGSNSIYTVANNVSKHSGIAMLPAYTCESVIEPFIRSGWKVEFYNIKTDLSVDIDNLESRIKEKTPDILLVHRYFGFDTLAEAKSEIEEMCKVNNIVLIEDLTQALMSGFSPIDFDYAVASLRKWTAIPDGGIIISKNINNSYSLDGENKELVELSLEAYKNKQKYMDLQDKKYKDEFRKMFEKTAEMIDKYRNPQQMSEFSKKVWGYLDADALRKSRKENYAFLAQGIENLDFLINVFNSMETDVTPLYYPVYVREASKRKELQQYLASNAIYCPVIWPKPEEYKEENTTAAYIYDHILCIPCDQRYDLEDMQRIIDVLKNYKPSFSYIDVYYMKNWAQLNAERDNGIADDYLLESEYGTVYYSFIKRPIPQKIDGIEYYDTITPYGFSGPVVVRSTNKEKLLTEFENKFNHFCLENHIVAEYVRFSPWLFGYKDFEKYYQLKYNNQTVFTDLRKDFFAEEYSDSCRRTIRKAIKNNVEIQFDYNGETADQFIRLYNLTAEKNGISTYYLYTRDFIRKTFEMMKGNILAINAWHEGVCISSALNLYNEKYMHAHLLGNDYEYVSLGANSLIDYEAGKWAKERNIVEYHLGGAGHESLLRYKKSFTKNGLVDYYVGTRIRDQITYDGLVEICGKNERGYFPEYR